MEELRSALRDPLVIRGRFRRPWLLLIPLNVFVILIDQGCGIVVETGVGVGRSRPLRLELELELESVKLGRLRLRSGVED